MEALHYIHELGVAHRDIKLENILVTADDDAKLTDFGLCKQQHGNDPMLTTCGTLVYAAPEIIREEPYNGMKADIWSAGIVLYAMIANHFPWILPDDMPPERLMKETAQQIVEGNISLPDGISYELQNLLGNLLNVEPEDRPTAEEVLQHPWFDDCQEPETDGMSPNKDIVDLDALLHKLDQKREAMKKQSQ